MQVSKVFEQTLDAYISGKYSIIANYGGTRSTKTYSTLQLIYLLALSKKMKDKVITVFSRSLPHLKRGCLRDFKKILEAEEYAGVRQENKSDLFFIIGNNNKVEFCSAEDVGKLHGAQRDIVFVNECNYISNDKISQIFVRTSGVKFIDWNPTFHFWVDNYRERPDYIEFRSTYRDNQFLSAEQINEIESHKNNERWWRCYGEGLDYVREGLVYPDVSVVEDHEFKNPIIGLDFGFNDPTACVMIEVEDNTLYVKELFYKTQLDVESLKNKMMFIPKKTPIIADSARPELIKELHDNAGYNIMPCKKGKNSITDGVQIVNSFKIVYVGPREKDTFIEFTEYGWAEDKEGNYLDTPKDKYNHSMDAIRYAVTYLCDKPSGKYNYKFI